MLVLDLVKQTERREREVIVGREYRRAVEHVNSTMPPVSLQLACVHHGPVFIVPTFLCTIIHSASLLRKQLRLQAEY